MNESMIADSARRLFSENVSKSLLEEFDKGSFPDALWALVEESGFPMATVPESAGGIGLGWSECFPILWEAGYRQAPVPVAEAMVANYLIGAAGGELSGGRVALADKPAQMCVREGQRVRGLIPDVPWGRHCKEVLFSVDGRLALAELNQQSVLLDQHTNEAGEPVDTIRLEDAAVRLLPATTDVGQLRTFGALAYSALLCGALESCFGQALVYASERVQFGRAIANFQAIQQQLALLAGEIISARTATQVAFSSSEATRTFDTAAAKVRTGEAATLAANICHQVHGAIGFTREHPLHFATRRLWAWRARHGSDAFWAARLGEIAIDAGSTGFWHGFTRRFGYQLTGSKM